MFSIIVPVYNEVSTIDALQNNLSQFLDRAEIIFVDAGSTDGTLDKYRPEFLLIQSDKKQRAYQMNLGAQAAKGSHLLFLHADSLLPKGALEQMESVMDNNSIGCFGIIFDDTSLLMRICANISNRRVLKRNIAFGDQGIFLTKESFFELGMFPEIALMEDYQFALNASHAGHVFAFTKDKITTSARRYGKNPIKQLKLMWDMRDLRELYVRGVPAEKLLNYYRDIR